MDINSASQKQLEALKGIGPATARKIIAGRPFASVGDLSRVGVPAGTIRQLSAQLTAGAAPAAAKGGAAAPAAAAGSGATAAKPSRAGGLLHPGGAAAGGAGAAASSAPAGSSAPTKPAVSQTAPAPGSGMVWVNLDSKIFHREGSRWYGKTAHGQYMTEAEAIKMGCRESKTK